MSEDSISIIHYYNKADNTYKIYKDTFDGELLYVGDLTPEPVEETGQKEEHCKRCGKVRMNRSGPGSSSHHCSCIHLEKEEQEKDWIDKVFEETRKQEVVHWTQLGRANSATPETVAKVREEITKRNILKFMPQLKTEGTIPVVKVDLQGTYKIVDGENKGEFLWNSDAIIKAKNFDKTEVSDTSNIVKDLTIEVWERHMQKPTYRNELRGIIKKHLGKSVDTPSDREKNLLVKLKLVGDYKLAPEETLKKRISEHRNAVIDDCKDFIKKNNPPRKKGVEFKGRNLGVADCLKSLEQLKTPL